MRFNFKNSLLSLFLLISFVAQAQNGLNFQGVARNSNNIILASQPISLRLSIVQGTTNAVTEYTEVRKVTTNAQGLFNVVIGDTGTISVTGNFSTIDWKLTPKFLKIEMDVAAGNNFSLIGTTQFQSVAYAQFANQVDAEKIIGVVPVAKGGTGVASITALKASLALDKTSVGLTNVDNTSDASKPISTATQTALDTKVDKVTGKVLSTNDYTTAEKTKLAAITGTNTGDQDLSTYATNAAITLKENAANKSTAIDLGASATSDILFPTQKAVKTYVDGQINSGGIADGGILTRHIADGAVTGSKLTSEINGYKKFLDGAGNVTISNTVTTDVDVNIGSLASGGTSNWQSFTAGLSGKLSIVEFQTVNPSSSGPAPIAYVEIYSGQGLSGTLLGTSTNISISGFGRNWYAFDLNATNIRIASGSVYTARLVVNTTNQNYVYGDNAIYNGGISNISSTWDLNIKTKIKQYSDDPYLTTGVATGLYGGLVSNATHTGDVTGATALTITDAAVTTSKIANSAVDLTTKVTGLLPTANIADGAITTAKIANSGVDLTTKVTGLLPTANIADGAITTAKIANSVVDLTTKVTGLLPTANIADGAITTAKIANNAVDLTTKVTGLLPTSKGGTGTITATANTFFATPDGTSGAPSFRGILASDIPSDLSSYIQSSPMSPQAASIDIGGGARIGGRGIIGNDLYVNNIYMGIGGTGQNNTNTAIGNTSLQGQNDGYGNTTLGIWTMKVNNGGYNNTSIGANALQNINTGNDNTAIGNYAMLNSTTGNFNTASGSLALSANTSTANTGSYNVANGYRAMPFNQTGSYNVGVGYLALNSNTTGSNNTAIGNQANVALGSLTNATAIGNGAIVSGSNQIQLGNSSVTLVQTSGGITAGGTLTANAGVFTSTTISGNASLGGTLTANAGVFTSTTISGNASFGGTLTANAGVFTSTTISGNAAIGGTFSVTGSATFTNDNTINGKRIGRGAGGGLSNTVFGADALLTNTTGEGNVAIGNEALLSNTIGNYNIAIGNISLRQNTSGIGNMAIGVNTLRSNISGSGNIALGVESLFANTIGEDNFASGMYSLKNNTSGSSNFASGYNSLLNNTTGLNNIAIGYESLLSNTIGSNNFATGNASLFSNTTGSNNFASGNGSLSNNTTGSDNFASGNGSLSNNTTGSNNFATGNASLYANTTGYSNIAIGASSLIRNTSGSNNIALGFETLPFNTTGANNFATGVGGLYSNTTGNNNFASGYQSMNNNTTGNNNFAFGNESLKSNTTGNHNVALGYVSLYANVDGSDNIAFGEYALHTLNSGNFNIAIGASAGYFTSSGSNNILIGKDAFTSTSTTSNQIVLGNSNISSLRAQVTSITALSDRRDKTDIVTIAEGIDFIKQLKPVTFTWNTRDKAKVGIKSAGFIAQDLLALQKGSLIGTNLDLVSEDNPEKLEARYNNLLPVMVKAIQDQQNIIEDQKKRLDALEKLVNELLKKQ